jgi:hypothetical protein
MRVYYRKVPKSQRYTCTKRDIKEILHDIEIKCVSFVGPRNFEFDSRCYNCPQINGSVIATTGISRELEVLVNLYPIKNEQYSDESAKEFKKKVLPKMLTWIKTQKMKQKTAILGYEEFIVEFVENEHKVHKVRFL